MKITQEHIKATGEIFGSSSAEWLASVCNKAIEIAQAEAEQYEPSEQQNLVKLDGKLVTREAAIAKYEALKDTHDLLFNANLLFNAKQTKEWKMPVGLLEWANFDARGIGYRLRPKAKKQISWADMPVGIAVCCHEVPHGTTFIYQGGEPPLITQVGMGWQGLNTRKLTLAPAAEQPWIAVQDDGIELPDGLVLEVHSSDGVKQIKTTGKVVEIFNVFKVIGIESGYELGGN